MVEFLQKYYSNSIVVIYNAIMLIALFTGAGRMSKLSKSSRIFFLLLFITFFKEMLSYYLAITKGNNSSISNGFMLFEFLCISMAFYMDTNSRFFLRLLLLLLLYSLADNIYFRSFFDEQNYRVQLVTSLLIIVAYFSFLVQYFQRVDAVSLVKFPVFWFGLGFLLFSIASIVSFGFSVIAQKGSHWHTIAAYSIQYSNYLLYLLFVPAFLSSQNSLRDFIRGK